MTMALAGLLPVDPAKVAQRDRLLAEKQRLVESIVERRRLLIAAILLHQQQQEPHAPTTSMSAAIEPLIASIAEGTIRWLDEEVDVSLNRKLSVGK